MAEMLMFKALNGMMT